MPKGVYDRSKSKAQRAAEKGSKADEKSKAEKSKVAAPKRKYTRKAAAADLPNIDDLQPAEGIGMVKHVDIIYEARINLSSLVEAYAKVEDAQFRSLLVEKMTNMVERIEPKPTEELAEEPAEVKTEKKAEKAAPAEAEVTAAQAPAVPYPAPLPFNGANPQS